MNPHPFQDPRAHDLLSRVSEDVSLLRQDVRNLFSHAARHTIPESARGLADSARHRLAAGKTYTAEHLRVLRSQMQQPAAAWVGGAVAVGLLAAGVYWFLKSDCCRTPDEADEEI